MHPKYTLVPDVEVVCVVCGTAIRTFPSIARRKKYCSNACKNFGASLRKRTEAERFWEKVDMSGGDQACWPWLASTDGHGYGQFMRADQSMTRSSRMAWILEHHEIPSETHICHSCDNPICCNPAHLFAGTVLDNMRDMHRKKRWSPTPSRGSKNGSAKYTEEQVAEVRRLRAEGVSRKDIAVRFGISIGSVKSLLRKGRWAHVE